VMQSKTLQLPNLYSVDLSLQNSFKIAKYGVLTAIIEVMNLTDKQITTHDANFWSPYLYRAADVAGLWATPRNFMIKLKYSI
jgi:hypothetical protein